MRDNELTLIVHIAEGARQMEYPTTVWANRKATNRAEFYAAYDVGLKVSHTFDIDANDWLWAAYNGVSPTMVQYAGQRYNIIRTYEHGELVEVVVG